MISQKVDVIIVTYNSQDTIAKCLKALLSQKDTISKIIIVDNNSQDMTLDIIKEFSTSLPIKVIKLRYNLGFAKAVKLALLFSKAPYVLLLNPDAIISENYIKFLTSIMEQPYTIKLGILEGIVKKGCIIISDGSFFDPLTGFDWSPQWKECLSSQNKKLIELRDYVPLTAAVVRRELLELLDENYFLYNEDLDLALSIRKRGYYTAVTSRMFVEHEIRLRKRELSEMRMYNYIKGRLYLFQKNLPRPFSLTSSFIWMIVLSLTLLFIDRKLARASVLAITHFYKNRWLSSRYKNIIKNQKIYKTILPLRTLTALKHIIKHIAYGGHSW